MNAADVMELSDIVGYNFDLIGGVSVALSGGEPALVYAAEHVGVLHTYNNQNGCHSDGNKQFLKGHRNKITAICVSANKQWIVTADRGEDNLLVVWEASSGLPKRVYLQPNAAGTIAVCMNLSGTLLATLSAPLNEELTVMSTEGSHNNSNKGSYTQKVDLWMWQSESDIPIHSLSLRTESLQRQLVFNQNDERELMTTGSHKIFFLDFDDEKRRPLHYTPSMTPIEFQLKTAGFTSSVFIQNSQQAATGTRKGDVIIWDFTLILDKIGDRNKRTAVKLVNLWARASLSVITWFDNYIVVGASDGAVRFYDKAFRLEAWFDDFQQGAVAAISFEGKQIVVDKQQQQQEEEVPFNCGAFVVSTSSGEIHRVDSKVFHKLTADSKRGDMLVQTDVFNITHLCCHPTFPLVGVVGVHNDTGYVRIWNHETKALQTHQVFNKHKPTVMSFAPHKHQMAIGFSNGVLKLFRSETYVECASISYIKSPVSKIRFSMEASLVAAVFGDHLLAIYTLSKATDADEAKETWFLAATYKFPVEYILELNFHNTFSEVCGEYLYVLTSSGKVIEYRHHQQIDNNGGTPFIVYDVDQDIISKPISFDWYKDSNEKYKSCILIACDDNKFRTWDIHQRRCVKTVLAPCGGSRLSQILFATHKRSGKEFLFFYCKENYLGISELPLTGNPMSVTKVLAHSGKLGPVAIDCNCSTAFTCGDNGNTILQWKLSPPNSPTQCGNELHINKFEPFFRFYGFKDMVKTLDEWKNIFCYAQIKATKTKKLNTSQIDMKIPIDEMYTFLCALEYFPSKQATINISNEIKFEHKSDDASPRITFEQAILIYFNHRILFPFNSHQFYAAVEDFQDHGNISLKLIYQLLQNTGEKMSLEEINDCAAELPTSFDDGASTSDVQQFLSSLQKAATTSIDL